MSFKSLIIIIILKEQHAWLVFWRRGTQETDVVEDGQGTGDISKRRGVRATKRNQARGRTQPAGRAGRPNLQILIREVWGEAWDPTFLTCSLAMSMLLVHTPLCPHFLVRYQMKWQRHRVTDEVVHLLSTSVWRTLLWDIISIHHLVLTATVWDGGTQFCRWRGWGQKGSSWLAQGQPVRKWPRNLKPGQSASRAHSSSHRSDCLSGWQPQGPHGPQDAPVTDFVSGTCLAPQTV